MPSEKQGKSPSKLFRQLSEKWPEAFNPSAPRPLKIGIHHDIRMLDDQLSDDDLSTALRAYTRMGQYLAQLRAGAARVGLDGNPAGEVSDADAAAAKALLRTRNTKHGNAQIPAPTAQPAPLPKPEPKHMFTFEAKRTADRSEGVIVETKRRRSFRKPTV